MQVQFRTKEEANREQERDFLALTTIERIYRFLELMQLINQFPTKAKRNHENKFFIEIVTKK